MRSQRKTYLESEKQKKMEIYRIGEYQYLALKQKKKNWNNY